MPDLELEGHGGTALKCFECVYLDCGIRNRNCSRKLRISLFLTRQEIVRGRSFPPYKRKIPQNSFDWKIRRAEVE